MINHKRNILIIFLFVILSCLFLYSDNNKNKDSILKNNKKKDYENTLNKLEENIEKGNYYFFRPYIKNNYEKSINYYRNTLEKDKDNYKYGTYSNLRKCYIYLNNITELIELDKKRGKYELSNLSDSFIIGKKYIEAINILKKQVERVANKDVSLYYRDFIYPYYCLKEYNKAINLYRYDTLNVWFIPIFIETKEYERVEKVINEIKNEPEDPMRPKEWLMKSFGIFTYTASKYYFKIKKDYNEALKMINYGIKMDKERIEKDIKYVEMLKRRKLGDNDERLNYFTEYWKKDKDFSMKNAGLEFYTIKPTYYISISDMFKLKSEILKAMGENKKAKEASKQSKEWEGKKGYRDFIEFVDDDYMKDDPEYQRLFLNE